MTRKFARHTSVFLLAVSAICASTDVTPESLINAAAEPQNWLTYGGTYNAWRYSALTQINRDNVRKLVPVWAFQTGKAEGGFSCTPLVADGIMYITSPGNRVFALD